MATNYVSSIVLHAVWLRNNPGKVLIDSKDGCHYKYDPIAKGFYWHNPANKIRKGWYRSKGLEDYYTAAICSGMAAEV